MLPRSLTRVITKPCKYVPSLKQLQWALLYFPVLGLLQRDLLFLPVFDLLQLDLVVGLHLPPLLRHLIPSRCQEGHHFEARLLTSPGHLQLPECLVFLALALLVLLVGF